MSFLCLSPYFIMAFVHNILVVHANTLNVEVEVEDTKQKRMNKRNKEFEPYVTK